MKAPLGGALSFFCSEDALCCRHQLVPVVRQNLLQFGKLRDFVISQLQPRLNIRFKNVNLKINKNEILRPYKTKDCIINTFVLNYRAYFSLRNFLKQNFQFNFLLFLIFFLILNSLLFYYLIFNGKIEKKPLNPQALVGQKIAGEVVFRRFQGEGVEFI